MSAAPKSRGYLFGKVPVKADFLALGEKSQASAMLESWLSSMVEQARGQVPAFPLRFVLAPEGGEPRLGVLVPSHDEVGRAFPLSYLAHVPDDLKEVAWPLWLPTMDSYLDAAEACLSRAAEYSPEALYGALAELPLPHPSAIPNAIFESRRELAEERILTFASKVFPEQSLGQLAYALYTLGQAIESQGQDVTLDVRCDDDFASFVWCKITHSRARRDRPVQALLWAYQAKRAFLCFGDTLDAGLFSYLNAPEHPSSRRWPLSTQRAEAMSLGHAQLSAPVRTLFDQNGSLSDLIRELCR